MTDDTSEKNILAPSDEDREENEALLELHNRIDDIAQRMKGSPLVRAILEAERSAMVSFDDERRMEYLLALAAGGRKGDAAAFAGVTPRTVTRHRNDDEEFAELEEAALEFFRDKVRAAIHEEGVEGSLSPVILRDSEGAESIAGWTRKRNPKILELAAKLLLPEYRDRLEVSGGLDVKVGVLAVTGPPTSVSDWSDRHGGKKLDAPTLPATDSSGTVKKTDKVDRA